MKNNPIISALSLLIISSLVSAEPLDCVINPNSTVELGSYEDGVLTEIFVERGDRVTRGQPLAKLDSEIEKMRVNLSRIRANSDVAVKSSQLQAEFTGRELKRLANLSESKSVSTSVYEEAQFEYNLAEVSVDEARLKKRIAEAEYQLAESQLQRRTVTSPFDGLVVEVVMSPGEYVHSQSTLMSIAAIDPLYVEVYLPVASYGEIEKGMSAVVRPEEPIGGEYTARLSVIDHVFDASSRTFGVRLELPNPELVLPGGVRCTVEFGTLSNINP